MRWYLLLLSTIALSAFAWAFNPVQNDRNYQAHMDLTTTELGRIKVTVVVPKLTAAEAIYNMPKIVPGTYKIYDYGQFVHELKAFNSQGEALAVEQLNVNQWKIANSKSLYKIEYWASASYNTKRSKIFAPAGTAITKNAFLLNNFGFIGYLEGFKDLPFTLEVAKPTSFYGSTSLTREVAKGDADVFSAKNYFELHDCPILYAVPDTANLMVAGIPVHIGVYSPEGNISAKRLREALIPVFEAAARYLGDTLPAKKYTILVYGQSLAESLTGSGALEHHTSTVVNMPDINDKMMAMISPGDPMKMYRDIVAHEFFHIVTPLNIHARQINDYDFINPQMSAHLWLYEGVTEYNAMISQARAGIIPLDAFIEEVHEKMATARQYNEQLPFTQISTYALSFFENQYHNVYQKGALIGLAVDLKLRTLSNGNYGLINLLEDLWTTYGQDTFFVDDQLFGIIAKTSGYPQMEEFFARHVSSAEPLPLTSLLNEVGIWYEPSISRQVISKGNIKLVPRKAGDGMTITKIDEENAMIQALGLKKYDVITAWNGVSISGKNGKDVLDAWAAAAKPGDEIELTILRETSENKFKKAKLKATTITEVATELDVIRVNESITDKQLLLRKKWINQ
jgi:predicted metalloprotease with PDZ domain